MHLPMVSFLGGQVGVIVVLISPPPDDFLVPANKFSEVCVRDYVEKMVLPKTSTHQAVKLMVDCEPS